MRDDTNRNERLAAVRESPAYLTEAAVLDFTIALWDAMQSEKVSQAELARRIDSAPAYVSRVLGGADNVTLRTMVRMAHALGLRVRVDLQKLRGAEVPMESVTYARFAPTRDSRSVRVVNSIPFAANDKSGEMTVSIAA